MQECNQCPRRCNVSRQDGVGRCGEGERIRVAKILPHFLWEEPCITGQKGVLAIFFSGCSLHCSYCQNQEISSGGVGETYSPAEFAALLAAYPLTDFSAIELITPSHFATALQKAFSLISAPIPVVWNSSGYETTEMVRRVALFVDVFLVDFKYADADLSVRLSGAADYPAVAEAAIVQMHTIKPEHWVKEQLVQGVLIRHLILPGQVRNSCAVLDTIARCFPNSLISIMSQFTPNGREGWQRKIWPLEAKIVQAHAQKLGLQRGYVQEIDSADAMFVPDFRVKND